MLLDVDRVCFSYLHPIPSFTEVFMHWSKFWIYSVITFSNILLLFSSSLEPNNIYSKLVNIFLQFTEIKLNFQHFTLCLILILLPCLQFTLFFSAVSKLLIKTSEYFISDFIFISSSFIYLYIVLIFYSLFLYNHDLIYSNSFIVIFS